MQEVVRLIMGLREIGLTEKEINDFLVFIESGDEKFKPPRKIPDNSSK